VQKEGWTYRLDLVVGEALVPRVLGGADGEGHELRHLAVQPVPAHKKRGEETCEMKKGEYGI
jgi:hypothetical protein